ncbi:MAG TPA: arsenate reductase ArsC, partial [Candidatus Binataceae bacterium]|nr:arsenate reductase ArsC [Candidatus Binataceae bacterium]
MVQRALNVLFVCRGNDSRSIMAEALLHRFSDGRFKAFSAGIAPEAEVHPHAAEMLRAGGISIANLKPKSVEEFVNPSAPKMDFVISMGKDLAPSLRGLPGSPMRAQWGISDPIGAKEPGAEKSAFGRTFRELETRIRLFVLLRHHEA